MSIKSRQGCKLTRYGGTVTCACCLYTTWRNAQSLLRQNNSQHRGKGGQGSLTVVDASGVGVTVRGVQDGALTQLDGLVHRQVEAVVAARRENNDTKEYGKHFASYTAPIHS
jgi:hypothetical protein